MVDPSQHVQSFLNERAVSKILGVSLGTIRRWRLRSEGPPFVKLGTGRAGAVRYPVAALESWLASRPAGGGTQQTEVAMP